MLAHHLSGLDPVCLLLLLMLEGGWLDVAFVFEPHDGRRAHVGAPGGVEDGAADGWVGEDARPRDDGRHDLGDVV